MVFALLSAATWTAAAVETTRVALVDFATEDRTYRDLTAASDFAAALQASLSAEPEFAWVERSQWRKAAEELELTAYNQGSLTKALRAGKWAKADLLVVGDFHPDRERGLELKMEVIDVDHADVLAACEVVINTRTNEPLSVTGAKVSESAKMLSQALREARAARDRTVGRRKIAPLFFGNTGDQPRLDFFEADLFEAMQKASGASSAVHVLRLPRAREATEESELVVGGLVQADAEAWQHLADIYVWGSFTEQAALNVPFEEVPVELTWYLWDGHTEPQQFRKTLTVAELPKLSAEVARTAMEVAQRPTPAGAGTPEIRRQVAQMLLARANNMHDRFAGAIYSYATPQVREWWQYEVNTLDVARFFDPGNALVQRAAVMRRWEPLWGSPSPIWFRNDLWNKERCTSDLGGVVDKFGLVEDGKIDNALGGMYVQSICTVYDELSHADRLADWPEEAKQEWHGRLDQEFLRRIETVCRAHAKFPEKYPPPCLPIPYWDSVVGALWDHACESVQDVELRAKSLEELWSLAPGTLAGYEDALNQCASQVHSVFGEIDQPEKGERLVGAMEHQLGQKEASERQKRQAKVAPAAPSAPPKQTPNFSVGPLHILPPRLTPPIRRIDLRAADEGINGLWFAADKLWVCTQQIAVDHPQTNAQSPFVFPQWAGAGLPSDLYPQLIEPARTRFLAYAPPTGEQEDLTERLEIHSKVTSLLSQEGKLWLTLQRAGLWRLDARTLEVRRFGAREGLDAEELYSCACVPPSLFFGGGSHARGTAAGSLDLQTLQCRRENFAAPPTCQLITMAAYKEYLLASVVNYDGAPPLVIQSPIFVSDIRQHTWTDIKEDLRELLPRNSLGLRGYVTVCSADENGFWLGLNDGMLLLRPGSGAPPDWVVRAWLPDGREAKSPQALSTVIPARNGLPPVIHFRGCVTAMAQDGDFLWVATTQWICGNESNSDDHMDTNNQHNLYLLHKPSGRWVGQIELHHRVTALAASPEHLWIGQRHPQDGPLLEVDKRPLLQLPPSQWTPEQTPEPEVLAAISQMPSGEEKARYLLSLGHTNEAITMLKQWPTITWPNAKALLAVLTPPSAPTGDSDPAAKAKETLQAFTVELRDAFRVGDPQQVRTLINEARTQAALDNALRLAAEFGQKEAIEQSLALGANVNAQPLFANGKLDLTGLMLAAARGREDAVKALLAHGAKLELANYTGNTALLLAACFGQARTAALLLEAGANVSAQNQYGWTSFLSAAGAGSVSMAKVLLLHGARADEVNFSGENALRLASSRHRKKMVAFLKGLDSKVPSQVTADAP
jgi:uncharacterized protein